jgi:hypothetical protein
VRRGLEKPLDCSGERIERVVEKNVTLANHVEDVSLRVAELGGHDGCERRISQRRDVQRRQAGEIAEVEQPSRVLDVALGQSAAFGDVVLT